MKLNVVLLLIWSCCFNVSAAEQLLVGTTGDYRPLTWLDEPSHVFSGEAIELLQRFAKDEGFEVTFVQTHWPELSTDLASGRFQMAVGGISATQGRAEQFLVSVPIAVFGKTALMRCRDQSRFNDFHDIDRTGIRIVENRGGTNERFALSRIKKATLIIVPNNHLPFRYLVENKADVMFTDSIEVDYISRINPLLCGLRSKKRYTTSEKVFLFRRDEVALQKKFNTWFKKQKK
ncbi:transporter substrate-binding domain-containing protein [Shewanella surugensis]|uniref:Transporter substrate-binding domain-containing protein n=1 Tax=Shewanella surugensis TaxID=212020 RepID=A0ABT0LCC2_9GAMM|nr:transporter substrate-binding domain-containing protein [Shewanella surugensis]MCL1125323.1 transporter substrate-binding domain-containing protein [Shewanella surugensis]